MNREPLQKALDALNWIANVNAMDYEYQRKARDSIKALEAELAKPTLPMSPEHLPQYIATNNIKPTTEGGGGAGGAQPEQITTPISPDQYERFCGKCGACLGKPWVGLTDEEIKGILNCGRGGLVDIKKAEQTLKDKNT